MFYTGIGSRKTPKIVLDIFEYLGTWLGERGYVLRSGGAEGADSAFERGCDRVNGQKEIYLPWKEFNGNMSQLYMVGNRAMSMARDFHPAWERLSVPIRLLMARNVYQVLGADIERADDAVELASCLVKSDFVICYTEHGATIGGTAQAIRIAQAYGIPIFNAGAYESVQNIKREFNKFWEIL